MNWYIGQKIVCVKSHQQGWFKEGEIFTINGLRKCLCKCNTLDIDIGMIDNSGYAECYTCKSSYYDNSVLGWFNETRFAPLDEMQAHESAIKELLKENEIHETIH